MSDYRVLEGRIVELEAERAERKEYMKAVVESYDQRIVDRLQAVEDRLDGMAQIDPEMMGAITKAVSEANANASKALSMALGLLTRIHALEDAQPGAVTLEPIIEDHQVQDLNSLDLAESARNMAGLFLTLVSAGATPQIAADMATTWLILQETGNE